MLNDILLTTLTFVAVYLGVTVAGLERAGAIALVAALGVATWRLYAAGGSWSGLGLRAPPSWWIVPAAVIGTYAAIMLASAFVITPVARAWNWPPLDLARLGGVEDNPRALMIMLAIAWTTAAFGEEMLFRGFLQTRLEAVSGGGALASAGAIVAQAAAFGLAHAYLGIRGAVTASAVGLIMGLAYVVCGRNLWPLIVSHGIIDSVSLIAIYTGAASAAP